MYKITDYDPMHIRVDSDTKNATCNDKYEYVNYKQLLKNCSIESRNLNNAETATDALVSKINNIDHKHQTIIASTNKKKQTNK